MPGAEQVERRVGGPEVADVEDSGQAVLVAGDEKVARHQVGVVHEVGRVAAGQVPQRGPHPAQPG